MIEKRRYWHCIFACLALAACGSDKNSGAHDAPSSVSNATPESALTTVTLNAAAEQRLGIEVVPIEFRSVTRRRVFSGIVAPSPGADALVTAPFAGVVGAPTAGLPLPGTAVRRNDPILTIQGVATQTAGVSPAEDLRVRIIELENARARLRRTTELLAIQGASEEELDQARVDVARAEAVYNSLSAQVGGQGDASGAGTAAIRAPLTGILGDYSVGLGQMVSAGQALFRVTDLDSMVVRVPMFPGEAMEVSGDAVAGVAPINSDIDAVSPAARIAGSPTATATTGSVDIYFNLRSSETRFRPGERVEVSVPLGAEAERPVVPHSSIFTDIHGGNWIYEKTADGTFVRRRVVVDYIADDMAVLSSGPAPGSLIVSVGVAELAGTEFGVGK